MKSYILVASYLITASLGQVLFKFGANREFFVTTKESSLYIGINSYSLIGLVLYGFSFILFMFVLSKYNLSYIIPTAIGLLYIAILFFSFVILKETFTVKQIIGSALILCGLIFMNLPNKNII